MERGKWKGGAVPSTDTQIKPTAAQDIRVVEYLNVEQRVVEEGGVCHANEKNYPLIQETEKERCLKVMAHHFYNLIMAINCKCRAEITAVLLGCKRDSIRLQRTICSHGIVLLPQ